MSKAFCQVIFYNLHHTSRQSFDWMCFYSVFVGCCQSLLRVYAWSIAVKSTCRLAYEYGTMSSLNGATSSFFWQVSIFTECTVGKVSIIKPFISFDNLKWWRSYDFIGCVGSKQRKCTIGAASDFDDSWSLKKQSA